MTHNCFPRREFLAGSSIGAATLLLSAGASATPIGKKTITILHTNDLHSNFLGMSPASDYSPFTLNDDKTRGGFARLAALIATRREAREKQGPVLVLDGGDYSMGTAFGAAIRETGAELQLMSRMGYDATTLGNHDFDLGPDGLSESIEAAVKAGRLPAVVAIEIGALDRGYRTIDISAKENQLYSLACPLYLGLFIVAIPKYTQGKLTLVPKGKNGQPLKSKTEAIAAPPPGSTPDLLPPRGMVDRDSFVTVSRQDAVREIKEWQAIRDYLRTLPVTKRGDLPKIPVDERAAEVRSIQVG